MQIPQYGQEAGGQGLQVAEVGVIFLSRLISALGLCQPRAAPSPAQLAAPAWSLRPGRSQLRVSSSPRLGSVSVGLLCCGDHQWGYTGPGYLPTLTQDHGWHQDRQHLQTCHQAGRQSQGEGNYRPLCTRDTCPQWYPVTYCTRGHVRGTLAMWWHEARTCGQRHVMVRVDCQNWIIHHSGSKPVSLGLHQPRPNVTIMHRKFCLLTSMAS